MKTPQKLLIPAAFAFAGLFLSASGAAQVRAPGPKEESLPATLPVEGDSPDIVFRAFDQFVERERKRRLVGGAGGIVFGATTMGVGSFVAAKTDTTKTPWLAGGGTLAGLSLLAMIFPTDAERLASKVSSFSDGHTENQAQLLRSKWRALAASARTERLVGSAVGFVLGAGSVTTGIAFASGAGNLSERRQAIVGGVLIGTGVSFLTGSAYELLMPSDAESSFEQYSATRERAARSQSGSLQIDFAAAPSGFFLGAKGSF